MYHGDEALGNDVMRHWATMATGHLAAGWVTGSSQGRVAERV